MTIAPHHPTIPRLIEKLAADGFVIVPNALDPVTLAEAQEAVAQILEQEKTEKDREGLSKRSFGIAVKHPVFRRMACHPLVVEVWQAYLGEDMLLSTWSSNTVLPGAGGMNWHADHPYWAMKEPWPQGVLAGQTLWMLDDFNEANGATGLVPRSHLLCHKPDCDPQAPHPDQVLAEASAGSVLLFDGRLWHSSRPNQTSAPRTCLLGMYIRACCVPMEEMRQQLELFPEPTEWETQIFGGKQRQPTRISAPAPANSPKSSLSPSRRGV